MGKHIIDGQFKSDKYPDCPLGLVPLKPTDEMAQDLLFEYAVRRREVDPEFCDDLIETLRDSGYYGTGIPILIPPLMAEVTVPDGFQSCPVVFNDKVIKLLERLVDTGLFGLDPSEAVERLVEHGLEKRFFIDEPHA